MSTHDLGRRFEDMAARWLTARGWRIVDRNVRFQRREVDLIVQRGSVVAFVEVKGRRSIAFGRPEEALTAHKRGEIESVARWWVARRGDASQRYRFDVVAIAPGPAGSAVVDHIEDAWRP